MIIDGKIVVSLFLLLDVIVRQNNQSSFYDVNPNLNSESKKEIYNSLRMNYSANIIGSDSTNNLNLIEDTNFGNLKTPGKQNEFESILTKSILINSENISNENVKNITFLLEYKAKKQVFCKCKKSKCKKNYCECFAKNEKCIGCSCDCCENKATDLIKDIKTKTKNIISTEVINRELSDFNNLTNNTGLNTINNKFLNMKLNTGKDHFEMYYDKNFNSTDIPNHIFQSVNPEEKKGSQIQLHSAIHTKRNLLSELNAVSNVETERKRKESESTNSNLNKNLSFTNENSVVKSINNNNNQSIINSTQIDEKNIDNEDDTKKYNPLLGCNCSKSNCRKKYCECFKNGKACTVYCRCVDCLNDFNSIKKIDKKTENEINIYASFKISQISIEIKDGIIEIIKQEYSPFNPNVFISESNNIIINKIILKHYQINNLEDFLCEKLKNEKIEEIDNIVRRENSYSSNFTAYNSKNNRINSNLPESTYKEKNR